MQKSFASCICRLKQEKIVPLQLSDIDGTNLREPSHTGPRWTGSAQARMSWTLTHESRDPEILKLWDVSWMNPTLSHKLVIRDTNYQINQDSVESDSFFIRLIERKQFLEDSSSSVTTAFDDSAFPDCQILFRAFFFCCDLSFNVFRSFQTCSCSVGVTVAARSPNTASCRGASVCSCRLSKCYRPD